MLSRRGSSTHLNGFDSHFALMAWFCWATWKCLMALPTNKRLLRFMNSWWVSRRRIWCGLWRSIRHFLKKMKSNWWHWLGPTMHFNQLKTFWRVNLLLELWLTKICFHYNTKTPNGDTLAMSLGLIRTMSECWPIWLTIDKINL